MRHPPQMRNDGPGAQPETAVQRKIKPAGQQTTQRPYCTASQRKRHLPVADATRYRMFGRAKHDQVIVRRCPTCHFPHRHIAFEGATALFVRRPSCKPGSRYLVRVVETVPGIADISVMPAQRRAAS